MKLRHLISAVPILLPTFLTVGCVSFDDGEESDSDATFRMIQGNTDTRLWGRQLSYSLRSAVGLIADQSSYSMAGGEHIIGIPVGHESLTERMNLCPAGTEHEGVSSFQQFANQPAAYRQACTQFLVDPNYVLTTWSCLETIEPFTGNPADLEYEAVFDFVTPTGFDPEAAVIGLSDFDVSEVAYHNPGPDVDFALVKLASPVDESERKAYDMCNPKAAELDTWHIAPGHPFAGPMVVSVDMRPLGLDTLGHYPDDVIQGFGSVMAGQEGAPLLTFDGDIVGLLQTSAQVDLIEIPHPTEPGETCNIYAHSSMWDEPHEGLPLFRATGIRRIIDEICDQDLDPMPYFCDCPPNQLEPELMEEKEKDRDGTDPLDSTNVNDCLEQLEQPECDPSYGYFSSFADACICQHDFAVCLVHSFGGVGASVFDGLEGNPLHAPWCDPCTIEHSDFLISYYGLALGGTGEYPTGPYWEGGMQEYLACLDENGGPPGDGNGGGPGSTPNGTGPTPGWWGTLWSYFSGSSSSGGEGGEGGEEGGEEEGAEGGQPLCHCVYQGQQMDVGESCCNGFIKMSCVDASLGDGWCAPAIVQSDTCSTNSLQACGS